MALGFGADKLLPNVGVFWRHSGTLFPSTTSWLHTFVIKLPQAGISGIQSCRNDGKLRGTCYMKRNVTGTVPKMLQRMNDDVLYSLEQVQSFAMKNFRRVPSSKRRGKRSAPLSFIGDLTKGIVGLATMDDVGRIAQRVNQLVEKGNLRKPVGDTNAI